MIELSVTGGLLAKSEDQVWHLRIRTKEGIVNREGNFRAIATLLMKSLKVDSEEAEAAVCFMLDNEHDVAFFDGQRKCKYTYSSKSRKRMGD